MLKKCMLLILSILLAFSTSAHTVLAFGPSGETVALGNDYIQVTVDQQTGRFSIGTVAGHPLHKMDHNQPLLYGAEAPDTSFTTFRINGKDYIYGNRYGFLGGDGNFSLRPTILENVNQSVWHIEGLEITQTLTVIEDPDSPNLGNIKISYQVNNTSNQTVDIGSRILLDTNLGVFDSPSIYFEGRDQYVQTETEISGDMPYYWRLVDDPLSPRVIAYGFIKGWENIEPDRLLVAHWEGISRTKWDYFPDENLNIKTNLQKYGSNDSAISLYWDPQELAPGEQRVYETYYGLGNFFTKYKEAKYSVQTFAPLQLHVTPDKEGYEEKEFEIQAQIANIATSAETLHNVEIELVLPQSLELVEGQKAVIKESVIARNTSATYAWKVRAIPQETFTAARFMVGVRAEGVEDTTTADYILLPATNGVQPEVQMLELFPEKKYVGDIESDILIRGNGFETLKGNENVKIELVRQTDDKTYRLYQYDVLSDKQIAIDLKELWEKDPQVGKYTLKVDAGEYGGFESTLELTEDPKYLSRTYSILGIIKDYDGDRPFYRIDAWDNEEEMKDKENILITIRGDVRQVIGESGSIIYRIQPGATFNSVVLFEDSREIDNIFGVDQVITIDKKEEDAEHYGDYVQIKGTGVLSIPSFPFTWGNFSIELEDGTEYSLDAIANEDETPVTIEWQQLSWFDYVQQMSFFPVEVKHAVLGEESVTFGGKLKLQFQPSKKEEENPDPKQDDDEEDEDDPFKFIIDLEEARFGLNEEDQFKFKGLRAQGEVGIPDKFVPGLDFGASATVLIDTLRKIYSLEADVSFQVISVGGAFTIRFTDNNIPILDRFVFEIGNQPGIPLVPPIVVAYITRGGGGFENLYDTVMGNFEILPPLKLVVIAGLDISKILAADRMQLGVSMRGIEFEGEFEIFGFDFLEKLNGEIQIADQKDFAMYVFLNADLDIFDILYGNINGTISVSKKDYYLGGGGTLGVKIPKSVPFVGGKEVGEVEGYISTEDVRAYVKVIGVKLGVIYEWGSSSPKVKTASEDGENSTSTAGLGQQKFKHADGTHGLMTYGTNIRKVQSDESSTLSSMQMTPLVASEADKNMYTIMLQEGETRLVELAYAGDTVPELEVRDPNGEIYPLVEDENYLVQIIDADESMSGIEEKRVYISFVDQPSGNWTITSDQSLVVEEYIVDDLPEFESVNVEQTSDHALNVSWSSTTAATADHVVDFYLTEDPANETGMLLLDDVSVESGNTQIILPETLPSGTYYIRAMMREDQSIVHSMLSSQAISFENSHEPEAVKNVEVTPIGNGFFHVSWDADKPSDGYALQVLDEQGNPLENIGMVAVEGDQTEANIGGVYQLLTPETEEGEDDGLATDDSIIDSLEASELVGMIPGYSYQVSVTAFNEVEGKRVFGPSVASEPVYLEEPDPPEINLYVEEDDQTVAIEDIEGKPAYLTNANHVTVKQVSDQVVTSEVRVNGTYVGTVNGQKAEIAVELKEGQNLIGFTAVNEKGDMSTNSIFVTLDTVAPDLKIESPGPGYLASEPMVVVKGITEPGVDVTVNGADVDVDREGLFETTVSMDGYLSKSIEIAAEDEAGNRTTYISHAVSEWIDQLERVEIRLLNEKSEQSEVELAALIMQEDEEAANEARYEMTVGEQASFQLVGIDADGKSYVLNPARVTWDFLLGAELAELTDDGELQVNHEGDVVIKAAYEIANGYALEDAFQIKVTGQDDHPGEPDDSSDYMDWYDPDTPDDPNLPRDEIDDGTDDGDDSGRSQSRGSYTVNLDFWMEERLRFLIQAEQQMKFLTSKLLTQGQDVTIPFESGQLKLYGPSWEEIGNLGVGLGIGQVEDVPSLPTSAELVSEVYHFQTNQPVQFAKQPEVVFELEMDRVKDVGQLGIYWWNDQKERWEYVGGKLDDEQATIEAKLPRLGSYAVLTNQAQRNFADLEGRWSSDTVYRLASMGIIDGRQKAGAWWFEPTSTITRQEFIKLMVAASEMELLDRPLPNHYSDWEQAGAWAVPYLVTALEEGWLSGVERDGTQYLDPQREISRVEAAALLYRMLEQTLAGPAIEGEANAEIPEKKPSIDSMFKDAEQIPDWAKQAVQQLHSIGIINGYSDGTFRPQRSITREEAAVMFLQLLEWQYERAK